MFASINRSRLPVHKVLRKGGKVIKEAKASSNSFPRCGRTNSGNRALKKGKVFLRSWGGEGKHTVEHTQKKTLMPYKTSKVLCQWIEWLHGMLKSSSVTMNPEMPRRPPSFMTS